MLNPIIVRNLDLTVRRGATGAFLTFLRTHQRFSFAFLVLSKWGKVLSLASMVKDNKQTRNIKIRVRMSPLAKIAYATKISAYLLPQPCHLWSTWDTTLQLANSATGRVCFREKKKSAISLSQGFLAAKKSYATICPPANRYLSIFDHTHSNGLGTTTL